MVFLLLVAAAFAAGAINAVAGGGSFLTFPSLVIAGVPAVIANASNTVALVPGSVASAISYRRDIQRLGQSRLKVWFVISVLGGAVGAVLLLFTSDKTFRLIAPWLLLFATVLFAFGARINRLLGAHVHSNEGLMFFLLFLISIYGGYFGGGIGIMMLAAFRLYGMDDIHGMNGIKTILSGSLNAIASAVFILAHKISWGPTMLMMVAAIAGGYFGPYVARRMAPWIIRAIVIMVGIAMTAYFFRMAPQ
jgi:uncharacterized protein